VLITGFGLPLSVTRRTARLSNRLVTLKIIRAPNMNFADQRSARSVFSFHGRRREFTRESSV
jgi:hypothetical protein